MDKPSTNPCIKGLTVETCRYNPNLGCDCGANPSKLSHAQKLDKTLEELEGRCHALWLLSGRETEEWNGESCKCSYIQGYWDCKLNPY